MDGGFGGGKGGQRRGGQNHGREKIISTFIRPLPIRSRRRKREAGLGGRDCGEEGGKIVVKKKNNNCARRRSPQKKKDLGW